MRRAGIRAELVQMAEERVLHGSTHQRPLAHNLVWSRTVRGFARRDRKAVRQRHGATTTRGDDRDGWPRIHSHLIPPIDAPLQRSYRLATVDHAYAAQTGCHQSKGENEDGKH